MNRNMLGSSKNSLVFKQECRGEDDLIAAEIKQVNQPTACSFCGF